MKIKVTASVQQLRDISIPDSEARRLSGAIVDGARLSNSWTTPDLSRNYSSNIPWSLYSDFAVEVKQTPALDLSKPVQTRDGRAVEIKYVDESLEWPINGIVTESDGKRFSRCWQPGGVLYGIDTPHPLDLVQAPEPTRELWLNCYENRRMAAPHPTRVEADTYADKDRIACIKISYRKGEGL